MVWRLQVLSGSVAGLSRIHSSLVHIPYTGFKQFFRCVHRVQENKKWFFKDVLFSVYGYQQPVALAFIRRPTEYHILLHYLLT